MSFRIICLAKQVPDTRNVGKDAMKADGTVNRAALPAIFNPEDLNALEQALRIKDSRPDAEVILLTMGPARAAEIIREGLYRGADKGYLITDRKFAGSDTLATSYVLSLAIRKLAPFKLIISGRQAIDGDTAQVGPQTAEKLGIPQVTYAEEIISLTDDEIVIKRRLEKGVEIVRATMPLAITVHNSAPNCRPRIARLVMQNKHARSVTELQAEIRDYTELYQSRPYLQIEEWGFEDIKADVEHLGLSGSPTKVKKIENVVLQHKATQVIRTDQEIEALVRELLDAHIIG
ncbi:MAG: electron transfer flavoprotein subunit beta/FixA family protein [Bacteroidales bacterium]